MDIQIDRHLRQQIKDKEDCTEDILDYVESIYIVEEAENNSIETVIPYFFTYFLTENKRNVRAIFWFLQKSKLLNFFDLG